MPKEELPARPSLPWRVGSSLIIGATGLLARTFFVGLNKGQVHGLDRFLELLDERSDIHGRQRGLVTGML